MSDSARPHKLTHRQLIFVDEYLKCFNGSDAARKAGYAVKHVTKYASALMQNPQIKQFIAERIADSQMSADEALIRVAQMARASITDVIDEFGDIDWQKVCKNGHLVKSISPGKFGTRIEIIDAQAALDKILRVHGRFVEKVENSGTVSLTFNADDLAVAKARANAAEKKLLEND